MSHAPAHIVVPSVVAGLALAGVFWYAQKKNILFGHNVPHTMSEEWKRDTEAMNACKERESSDVPVALNPFYHNYPASFKNSKNLK